MRSTLARAGRVVTGRKVEISPECCDACCFAFSARDTPSIWARRSLPLAGRVRGQRSRRRGTVAPGRHDSRMHVAYPIPGGFGVGEVWESRGQFETWFNENVKPNVPGVQHEVIELHAVVQP
jgi:hypothetical protein